MVGLAVFIIGRAERPDPLALPHPTVPARPRRLPPQKRPERPRAVTDLDLAVHLQLDRIDHADRVALPVRHDELPAVRRRRDPFRVIAYGDALDRRER